MHRTLRSAAPLLALLATVLGGSELRAQAVTTAAVTGRVTSDTGAPVANAQVVLTNTATGSQRSGLSREDGRFLMPGLRPGGPYRLLVTSIGYADEQVDGIELALGETRQIDVELASQAVEVAGIEVTAARGNRVNTGMQTIVSQETIERAPTINREIVDVARFTPGAFVSNEDDDGAAISIAGQNAEFNSLYIDGVVNNDVFGLSAQGTNGGQTGAPPISFDAIEQIQVAVSPFDVTQSGFTGGAINAITRSGTNDFRGSVYYQLRNESFAGESNWLSDPAGLPEFSTQRYGFRLGGPIIENKAFFFINGELFRSENPAPFGPYEGDSGVPEFERIRQVLIDEVGYDPGDFGDKVSTLDDNKLLAKLDWNITDRHRLTARHSYSQTDNIDAFASRERSINFANNSEVFPNTTNSSAVELNSAFGDRFANKLLVGLTFVRDDRDFAGDPFPSVAIRDGDGTINLGSEPFSTGNILNQDILSITNNFNVFAGDHTITIGTHNEFYEIGNLFLRENFGAYDYDSVEGFLQSVRAINDPNVEPVRPRDFDRGFSLVDDVAGDDSEAIGAFEAYQLGLYVQDEWRPTSRLRVMGGLRVDIPKITTEPRFAEDALTTTIPAIEQHYDLQGARPGKTPKAAPYIAPRVGFNYDLTEDGGTQLRGGLGVFTGRVPFVYPGAMYLNNGVTAGYVSTRTSLPGGAPLPFIADVNQLPTAETFGLDVRPSGELDLFAEDFRYPRVFRTTLGVDHLLPADVRLTLEGQYTKTVDNLAVTNVNLMPQNDRLDGPDNRPIYNYGFNRFGGLAGAPIDDRYTGVLLVHNTGDGYTYDVTAALEKTFGTDLNARFAYSYGDAYALNDLTSDQIWSIWRFNENVEGLNNIEEARSQFSLGHRLLGLLNYRQEFLGNLATTISAVYTGESGRTISYIIGGFTNDMTGEPSGSTPLAYVPQSAAELTFEPYFDRGRDREITVAEQQQAFDAFVSDNDYLRGRRGMYTEPNADRAPMEHVVDLRVTQEVFGNIGGRRNAVELTLDIFNVTALLNDDWGRRYNVGFNTVNLVQFEGFVDSEAGDLTPIYTYRLDETNMDEYWEDRVLDFGNYGSRWLMQLGARYTF